MVFCHSAPLFPSSLVKCGIVLFSFLAPTKAPVEGGLTIPDTTEMRVSGATAMFAHVCNDNLIYICDSLRRRKSFRQVGSRCRRGPSLLNTVFQAQAELDVKARLS